MGKSRVIGVASFRRLLKRIPDSAHDQFADLLTTAGPVLADKMRARLPSRTGALRAGISSRVLRTSLNLKVGLLGTPLGRAKLFYGHILDVGRRGKPYPAHRRSAGGTLSSYVVNLPALAGLHLIAKGRADFTIQFLPDYKKLTTAILTDASRGVGND